VWLVEKQMSLSHCFRDVCCMAPIVCVWGMGHTDSNASQTMSTLQTRVLIYIYFFSSRFALRKPMRRLRA
jgi:hypothetical protein